EGLIPLVEERRTGPDGWNVVDEDAVLLDRQMLVQVEIAEPDQPGEREVAMVPQATSAVDLGPPQVRRGADLEVAGVALGRGGRVVVGGGGGHEGRQVKAALGPEQPFALDIEALLALRTGTKQRSSASAAVVQDDYLLGRVQRGRGQARRIQLFADDLACFVD